MKVPFNNLKRHVDQNKSIINGAIGRVVNSGRYILGEECFSFEREFASFCGVANCCSVGNGTDALEIGLRAIGIRNGDKVATTANAGNYTTTALNAIGAVPIYVDINPSTGLISSESLGDALSKAAIKAVVVTHLYGQMPQMDELIEIASRFGVLLFEDCAQAHGAYQNNKTAGSFGAAASFSFYPTKNLGALGDGGAVVTNSQGVYEAACKLRQYGWSTKYNSELAGGRNSRLDEIQAAILREKLTLLPKQNEKRMAIAKYYQEHIQCGGIYCLPSKGNDYVAHLFVLMCDRREQLVNHLLSKGINSEIHYPIPDYRQASNSLCLDRELLPNTELFLSKVLSIPCYPELTDDEVQYTVQSINSFC